MTPRKPATGFWITVALLAVLVAYPLSFGPACWVASRARTDSAAFFSTAYRPMWWAMHRKVPFVSQILTVYAGLGMRMGDELRIPSVGLQEDGDFWSETIISD